MTTQKIIRTGNSLAVTIPAAFVRSLGLRSGDIAKVNAQVDKGKVSLYFSGIKQLTFSDELIKNKRG